MAQKITVEQHNQYYAPKACTAALLSSSATFNDCGLKIKDSSSTFEDYMSLQVLLQWPWICKTEMKHFHGFLQHTISMDAVPRHVLDWECGCTRRCTWTLCSSKPAM